jgi:hypothetical protein
MSTLEDLFDNYDPSDNEFDEQQESTCKFCGVGGLYWEDHFKGWRLVDIDDEPHVCDPKAVEAKALEGFE